MLGASHEVLGTYCSTPPAAEDPAMTRLDLRDGSAIERTVATFRPDAVAHLAALSRVEDAARGEETARAVNIAGTAHLVRAANAVGARLLLLSTDSVFDGAAGPYAEEARPAPVNVYGRTKEAAERIIREAGPGHLIVRTSLVYGWPGPGHHQNFVTEVIARLGRGERITAYTDMLRSPAYVRNVAELLARVIEREVGGVCHLSGRESTSMHDFAHAIAEVFSLDPRLIVAGLALGQDGAEARPRALGLLSQRAQQELGITVPGCREGLLRMREDGPGGLSP
ncbi:MAG: hypothetical protein A3K12_08030 [Candidatus Rokubacteria bacterium RIFCSPLOWO2_12_FULL_71_19]|nr:MAG: hypothetical protein A3K12_08030 [Candidatus Rokubacteria bacterium RIFCSPLOWO2_12_FULL_71_19]